MADSCINCKFYGEGVCMRYAPPPISSHTDGPHVYDAVWPRVKADDWCGEWAAVPAPA